MRCPNDNGGHFMVANSQTEQKQMKTETSDTKQKKVKVTNSVSFLRELVSHAIKLSTIQTLDSPISVQLTTMVFDGWPEGALDENETTVRMGLWKEWETAQFIDDEDFYGQYELETYIAHVSGYYSLYDPTKMSRLSGWYSMKVRIYRMIRYTRGDRFPGPWRLQYIAQLTGDKRNARVYLAVPFVEKAMYDNMMAPAGTGVFPNHSDMPQAFLEDDGKTHELRRFLAVTQGDKWEDRRA
jgi:hypothetical protein